MVDTSQEEIRKALQSWAEKDKGRAVFLVMRDSEEKLTYLDVLGNNNILSAAIGCEMCFSEQVKDIIMEGISGAFTTLNNYRYNASKVKE